MSRFLILCFLFLQVAVAAYACPLLGSTAATTELDATPMQDCAGMPPLDRDNPNLCVEHAHMGEQASPQIATPQVPMAACSGFFVLLPVLLPSPAQGAASLSTDTLALAGAPPHTVLHCCFRI